MNKKTVMIASGVVGLILGASACGSETYAYDVSGPVEGQQIDYDCPGTDLSMDAVAFVAGSGKGSSGGGSGKKSDSKSNSDSDSKKADSKKADSKKAEAPVAQPNTRSSSPLPTRSAAKAPANKGVSLKSKPEKPERLKTNKLPKLKYKVKPKGCESEYEIFVRGKGGYLYEQDVRKVDYDKCLAAKVKAGQKAKLFPLCTKG